MNWRSNDFWYCLMLAFLDLCLILICLHDAAACVTNKCYLLAFPFERHEFTNDIEHVVPALGVSWCGYPFALVASGSPLGPWTNVAWQAWGWFEEDCPWKQRFFALRFDPWPWDTNRCCLCRD